MTATSDNPRNYPDISFVDTDTERLTNSLVTAYEVMTGRRLYPADPARLFILWIADILIRLARLAVIYARIDELGEDVLDILAHDLRVDWYDDSYPIAAKRAVIKDSVKVHKRLGTKYAVVTALGSVFPKSEVQEWFEYGGEPFCFRIILDMTGAKAPADYFQVVRAAEFYKRLTAHLDEIIYQTSINIGIGVETAAYRYRAGMTGKYAAGTKPRRNVKGGVAGAGVDVSAAGAGYKHTSPRTGTKPRRNTGGQAGEGGVVPTVTAESFSYRVKPCGTSRCKNN